MMEGRKGASLPGLVYFFIFYFYFYFYLLVSKVEERKEEGGVTRPGGRVNKRPILLSFGLWLNSGIKLKTAESEM